MGSKYGRKLKRILLDHGCHFVRQPKAVIWYSPISKRHFTVDAGVKKRFTAEASLKQAGIDETL
jgi:hypothetical protein